MNKFVQPRPYADPEAAARKIMEIANGLEPYMDGRLLTELLNTPMLSQFKATSAEYGAGIRYAVDQGWLAMHESGTHFRFTGPGKELLS